VYDEEESPGRGQRVCRERHKRSRYRLRRKKGEPVFGKTIDVRAKLAGVNTCSKKTGHRLHTVGEKDLRGKDKTSDSIPQWIFAEI